MTYSRAEFLSGVKRHGMTVLRDDGEYRHVRFAEPRTRNRQFDLITWPGYLAYVGDMGDFVFSRLHDMFDFFRTDGDREPSFGYWAEKLQATDRRGGHKCFSQERFAEVINDYRLRWARKAAMDGTLTKEQRRELWDAVDDEVLSRASDGEYPAFEAAHDFEHRVAGRTYRLDDFWDHNFDEWSVQFAWACYAIAWGISLYDRDGQPEIAEKDAA
jgi:hypothetical protein